MIIYVDVLLAVNLLITYVLLLLNSAVLKIYVKKTRLVIGSALGAVYSLCVLAPEMKFLSSLFLKFIMCVSIVCVTYRLRSLKMIFNFCVCFFLVNIAFSGLMMVIASLLGTSVICINNASVYINLNFQLLLILTCCGYLLLKFIIRIFRRMPSNEIYRVKIYIGDLFVETTAMTDTGNSLTDLRGIKPVSIVNKNVLMPLLPENVKNFASGTFGVVNDVDQEWQTRLSVICADFVVGESLLPTVKADKMEIINKDRKIKHDDCIVALTDRSFDEMHCRMLLHPSLIGYEMKQEALYEDNSV